MRATVSPLCAIVLLTSLSLLSACGGGGSSPSPPAKFTIGGTVANLAGSGGGLVLEDNGGDNLSVSANGHFQFATAITSGGAYNVTVLTQPSSPTQRCTVGGGAGSATANITSITVECGHGEWAWMAGSQTTNQIGVYGTLGTSAAANTPAGRQYPATWTDASGDLWLFGGYGYDSNGHLLPMNDLWKFSGGQWTWMGGPTLGGQSGIYGTLGFASSNNIPGARFQAATWTDSSGNFWLFGGLGFDAVGNESPMNDLWKYSSGEWTWVGGSNVGLQQGNYGTLGVANSSNIPGGRNGAAVWVDSSGNVWIFGGIGYDESNPINGELSDLWKYSGGQWTWMGGPKSRQQAGVYGTLGIASASNVPGARRNAYNWVDASGNFWLFGGYAYDSVGAVAVINDLWKYSAGQWTWVAGPKIVNQAGVYGTKGTPSANNIPGARWAGVTWKDKDGNIWLFGGSGYYSGSGAGLLNDLWEFDNHGQWTWVGGSNTGNPTSAFGTQGALGSNNTPGGRFFLNSWVDAKGNLWLFGGYGQTTATAGNLNDLWMYEP